METPALPVMRAQTVPVPAKRLPFVMTTTRVPTTRAAHKPGAFSQTTLQHATTTTRALPTTHAKMAPAPERQRLVTTTTLAPTIRAALQVAVCLQTTRLHATTTTPVRPATHAKAAPAPARPLRVMTTIPAPTTVAPRHPAVRTPPTAPHATMEMHALPAMYAKMERANQEPTPAAGLTDAQPQPHPVVPAARARPAYAPSTHFAVKHRGIHFVLPSVRPIRARDVKKTPAWPKPAPRGVPDAAAKPVCVRWTLTAATTPGTPFARPSVKTTADTPVACPEVPAAPQAFKMRRDVVAALAKNVSALWTRSVATRRGTVCVSINAAPNVALTVSIPAAKGAAPTHNRVAAVAPVKHASAPKIRSAATPVGTGYVLRNVKRTVDFCANKPAATPTFSTLAR